MRSLVATGAETIASIATTWYGIFIIAGTGKNRQGNRFVRRRKCATTALSLTPLRVETYQKIIGVLPLERAAL